MKLNIFKNKSKNDCFKKLADDYVDCINKIVNVLTEFVEVIKEVIGEEAVVEGLSKIFQERRERERKNKEQAEELVNLMEQFIRPVVADTSMQINPCYVPALRDKLIDKFAKILNEFDETLKL